MMIQSSWYDDPSDSDQWRYWDGIQWTSHTALKSGQGCPSGPSLARGAAAPTRPSGLAVGAIVGTGAIALVALCGFLGLAASVSSSSEATSASEVAERSSEGDPMRKRRAARPAKASDEPSVKKSTSTTSSSKKEPAPSASPAADVKVTAGELIEEFEDNELAGDQKYKGKTVPVSGVVEKIDTDPFSEDEYLLDITDGGDFEFFSVTCHGMDNDVLSKLTVGDSITVIGDFDDGGDLGVDLKNCMVV